MPRLPRLKTQIAVEPLSVEGVLVGGCTRPKNVMALQLLHLRCFRTRSLPLSVPMPLRQPGKLQGYLLLVLGK